MKEKVCSSVIYYNIHKRRNKINICDLTVNKNSEELYCVTSFGLKTEVDEIQRDKNYAEHKLVG